MLPTSRGNKKKLAMHTSDSSETAGLPTLPGLEMGDALRLIDPASAELSRLWGMLIVTSRGTTYLLCSLVTAETHGTGLLRRTAQNVRGCEGNLRMDSSRTLQSLPVRRADINNCSLSSFPTISCEAMAIPQIYSGYSPTVSPSRPKHTSRCPMPLGRPCVRILHAFSCVRATSEAGANLEVTHSGASGNRFHFPRTGDATLIRGKARYVRLLGM